MGEQTTFDLINLVMRCGAFPNIGDFNRAKNAYSTLFEKGILREGENIYTMSRVGTAIPGKVTRSFENYLQDNCNVPSDKLRDATLTVIEARRATPVLSP
jgi:hypothetical protein